MNSALLVVSSLFICAECAKILGVFPATGYSQFILGEMLMTQLAKRGHDVTVISPYTPAIKVNNYRTISTQDVITNIGDNNFWEETSLPIFQNIILTYKFGNLLTRFTLENSNVQKLLQSGETFDAVIVEQFFNDAMKGFAAHFRAPLILFSSMGMTEWNKYPLGNPTLPSISALSFSTYTNEMTFCQRLQNTANTVFDYLYKNLIVLPQQQEYFNKYFSTSINFNEIVYNASVMLVNSHVTTSENVLLPYNMIEIGGFHISSLDLSKEILDYLNDAKDGAIYFSMGTNLKSSDLSNATLNSIFSVFGKLKQKVLWKLEKDLPNKPGNVFISKWFKQNDILAHQNVKLFITHGGLLSVTEAIFHGVPIIGIPIFADQKMNMARASRLGIAKVIPFPELSEETLFSAVKEISNGVKLQKNVKDLSKLIKDRPVKPLELAMYWVEYVIRHQGKRFDIPSMNMYWFQVYMFDITAFLLVNIVLLRILYTFLVRFIHRSCSTLSSYQKKQQ